MRLGFMETIGNGRRAATFLGVGALCALIYLVDILCAGLGDPGSAALTVNIALPLDLMVLALLGGAEGTCGVQISDWQIQNGSLCQGHA